MFKKRTRPTTTREREVEGEQPVDPTPDAAASEEAAEEAIDIADLLELRRMKRARGGIDSSKLAVGDQRKRRKIDPDTLGTVSHAGLREVTREGGADDELEGDEVKARRAVRANNFTQQTNALDVDKHMMRYIEDSMRERHGARPGDEDESADAKDEPWDPEAELYRVEPIFPTSTVSIKAQEAAAAAAVSAARAEKERKAQEEAAKKKKKANEEGSVTNSLAMLTAIPEVDLGMDTRLKNIEETEKAKRDAADAKRDRQWVDRDDLVASRFYRGQDRNKLKTDDERLQSAIAVELGQKPDPAKRQHNKNSRDQRTQVATDDIAMERFKKRMAAQRR
ncbi:hepatocellular carcinoma-associated antigen 59-domain-containing protein [Auriculariales sp. MPI-PUGE-AT-0066]|nr:hepatocellular carcinoma-associated antigen 59-domain-containing protein [Auriculariales sp. MPI-PUGE-AT-0066]